MLEDLLKTKISREVASTVAGLLSNEDLQEITDGRGVYIPFSRPLRDAITQYFHEQTLPASRRMPERPLTL